MATKIFKRYKLSITVKVTLWYTLILTIILLSAALFISHIDKKITHDYAQQRLINTVRIAADDIEYKNGSITISDYAQSLCLAESIEIAVFDKNRTLVYGGLTMQSSDIDLEHESLQSIGEESKDFYIYDIMIEIDGFGTAWVRGVFATIPLSSTADLSAEIFILALPVMLIVVIIAGYITTKIAFKPINRIIHTATKITGGSDLNERINIADSVSTNDEIYKLSETFNSMFDRLQRSFESEKRFSDNASHELQTPIAIIISQCEYLLESNDLMQENRDCLEKILKQSMKMSGLISELLMLSRGDDKRLKLSCDEFDLSETALMICEDMEDSADRKNITIITNIDDNIMIEADQTLIMRLLINLVSNAIKYGKNGGYIKVTLKQTGDMIRGEVEDNGIGIAAEDISAVWQRFYQVDKIKSSMGGYGLGLPLAKMIVDAHNGAISVRSVYGKGSVFSFTLSKITISNKEQP